MASAIEGRTPPEDGPRAGATQLDEAQRAWLADLYESNFTAVFRVCQRVLHDRDDAADAAHEVFLRAVDALPGEPAGTSARPWLLTVARNHCLDLLRRRKRLGTALVTLGTTSDSGRDAQHTVLDRQVIDAVLKQLGLRERQALWQSAVEERPVADIASYLGVTYMAAAQVLHRARRHAMVLGAKLAAILGLYQVGRPSRRGGLQALLRQAPPGGVQTIGLLVATTMMPLVLASLVSSDSETHRAVGAPGNVVQASLSKAAVSATVPPITIVSVASNPGAPGASAVAVPSVPLPTSVPLPAAGTLTVKSAIATVAQTINQLATHPLPSASPAPLPLPTPPPPKSAAA